MGSRRAQQQVVLERLPSLLRDIYEGKLLVPEVQHEPWDEERKLRLLESIYRGIPIGSMTIWRTAQTLSHHRSIGDVPLLERKETLTRDYLVDGIDRATVLFETFGVAFWRSDKSSRRRHMPKTATTSYAFDLRTQTFRINHDIWGVTEFPLAHLFDARLQHEFFDRIRSFPDGGDLSNHLSYLITAFFDFDVAAITFVSDDIENAQALLEASKALPSGTLSAAPKTTRWYCDTCSQLIVHSQDGRVEWLMHPAATGFVGSGLRIVHQASASPLPTGCQYDPSSMEQTNLHQIEELRLDEMLGPNGLINWLLLRDMDNLPQDELAEMLQRLHVPGYERARFHAAAAISQRVVEPMHGGPSLLTQDEIATILRWADSEGRKP